MPWQRSGLARVAVTLLAVVGTSAYGQAQQQNPSARPARSRAEETLDVWYEIGNKLVHNSYTWMWAAEHSGEHYGQLVVYYRANNLAPPDSRR